MPDVIVIDAGTGDRIVNVRSHEPPIPAFDRSILARRRMIELLHSDFTGQDTLDGELNLASILSTEAMKDDIAACGLGQISEARVFSKTGQYAIGEYKSRNPDFQFLMYSNFAHVPAATAGLARPWDTFRFETLTPFIARDTNGELMVAWPEQGVPGNPVQAYWVNYCWPQTGGAIFNKDLIDAYIEELARYHRQAEHRGFGCMFDYTNPVAVGYYQWPTLNSELDLNQNGVAYDDDAEEQESFLAAEVYYVSKFREEFGPDFALTTNGQVCVPGIEPDLQAHLNGFFMEFFPILPWEPWKSGGPATSFMLLWDEYNSSAPYFENFKGHHGPLFHTDLDLYYTLSGTRAMSGRVAALLFDGWWKYRPLDGSFNVVPSDMADPTWDTMVATLGDPTGDVEAIGTPGSGWHSYRREFAGGVVHITIDADESGISQVQSVGLGEPMDEPSADTTPPSLNVTPTLVGGVGAFQVTGGVASEPVVFQLQYSHATGPYTSTYSTSIAGSYPEDAGTYTVSVRLKDAAGNTSGFYSLGPVTVLPPVGGG